MVEKNSEKPYKTTRRGYYRIKSAMDMRKKVEPPNKDELEDSLVAAAIKMVEMKRNLERKEKEVENLKTQLDAVVFENNTKVNEVVTGAFSYLREVLEKTDSILQTVQANKGILSIEFVIEHNSSILHGINVLEKLIKFSNVEGNEIQSPKQAESEQSIQREKESEQYEDSVSREEKNEE